MKSVIKKILVVMAAASILFLTTGCGEEGTAEKAGKKVDQTLDSIKKKVDDATD